MTFRDYLNESDFLWETFSIDRIIFSGLLKTGILNHMTINKEDLQDDIDLLKYLYKASGEKIKVPKDFVGFAAIGGGKGESIIELQQDELIYFD